MNRFYRARFDNHRLGKLIDETFQNTLYNISTLDDMLICFIDTGKKACLQVFLPLQDVILHGNSQLMLPERNEMLLFSQPSHSMKVCGFIEASVLLAQSNAVGP